MRIKFKHFSEAPKLAEQHQLLLCSVIIVLIPVTLVATMHFIEPVIEKHANARTLGDLYNAVWIAKVPF